MKFSESQTQRDIRVWPRAFSWKVSSEGLWSRSPLLCGVEDRLAQETSDATSHHCYGSCSNPWNFWGLDRPWLWNWNLVDTRSTKRDQVEHSGIGYSAACGQAPWQHWVGAEFWKWNSLDHCVQLQSPTRTTCRVFLEMLCALLQKSAAIVFCYPAGFEEEGHSVTSFQTSDFLSKPVQDARRLIGPSGPSGLLQHEVNLRQFQLWWAWYHRPGSAVCKSSWSLLCSRSKTVFSTVFNTFLLTGFNCGIRGLNTPVLVCDWCPRLKNKSSKSSWRWFLSIIYMNWLNTLEVVQQLHGVLLTDFT